MALKELALLYSSKNYELRLFRWCVKLNLYMALSELTSDNYDLKLILLTCAQRTNRFRMS